MPASRSFAFLAYAIIVLCLYLMLLGGFGWYPAVPLVVALCGGAFAFFPAARRAGILACVCGAAFAALGVTRQKYVGPLEFGAFAALFYAATSCLAPQLARWLLVPFAFVESAWLASLARQAMFEYAAAGSPTPIVDMCGQYFLPLAVGVFLVVGLGATAFGNRIEWMFAAPGSGLLGAAGGARFAAYARFGATGVAVAAGIAFALLTWRDWQINQPCM